LSLSGGVASNRYWSRMLGPGLRILTEGSTTEMASKKSLVEFCSESDTLARDRVFPGRPGRCWCLWLYDSML
jgi:hypothetical protein